MVIQRGEIWWADLDEPAGSEPGYRRPVLVIQSNWANQSRLGTVTVVALTSNEKAAAAPGNVLLDSAQSGLRKTSVVNVSQVITLDREQLSKRVTSLPSRTLQAVEDGLRLFLDL